MADITLAHESYFSRSLPGSKLNRHLDERHEETKGRVFVLLKLLIEYIHWHVSTHTHTHIHTHTHTHTNTHTHICIDKYTRTHTHTPTDK